MQSAQYEAIFNDGERLIPGESHDLAETVRHKSSYRFFRRIIEADLERSPAAAIRILDLGCGVGHGSHALSSLSGVEIVGIDPSSDSIAYARANYPAPNITYVDIDAETFLARDEQFDYIVSRHALEHVENGLELARQYHCSRRLMINVPYREPEGNIHHRVHFIAESSFTGYDCAEFFYEDMQGVTETTSERLDFSNSIICILTRDDSPKVSSMLAFPFAPWQPGLHERILIETSSAVKQLEMRLAGIERTVENLTSLQDTVQGLGRGLDETTHSLSGLHETVQGLGRGLDETTQRLGRLHDAVQKLDGDRPDGHDLRALPVVATGQAMVGLEEMIHRLAQEKAEMTASLEILRSQLSEQWQTEHGKLIDQLNQPSPHRGEIDAHGQEIETIRTEAMTAQAEIERNRAEIEAMRAEMTVARAEIQSNKAEIDATRAEVEAIRRTFLFRTLHKITTIARR